MVQNIKYYGSCPTVNSQKFSSSFCIKVPGPVQDVQVTSLSTSAVELTWNDPVVTNGRIRGYNVTVRIRNLNGRVVYMTQTQQRNAAATGLRELICSYLCFSYLSPYLIVT